MIDDDKALQRLYSQSDWWEFPGFKKDKLLTVVKNIKIKKYNK